MKQKVYIFFAITILSVFMAIPSEAGYYMKKKAPMTTTVSAPEQPTSETASPVAPTESTTGLSEKAQGKKQGFFKRIFNTIRHKAEISQALYIILSIFWLGWLAMGINDNFQGYEWILCLVLYCLFWLPGFIYSLIKMGDYY